MSEELTDQRVQTLQDTGVETEEDSKYVEESDLKVVLKPIQLCKLLLVWKQKGKRVYALFKLFLQY